MKKIFTLLATVMALFVFTQKTMAENVYLLTHQTINGAAGNYTPDANNSHPMTLVDGSTYKYVVSQMPSDGCIYFRVGVNGWDNDLAPANDQDPVTVNGAQVGISWKKNDTWKISDCSQYDEIVIYADIYNHKVWATAEPSVYLLTAETINGTKGEYAVPSNHRMTKLSGTTYQYKVTTADAPFFFRIGVSGWDSQMQPAVKDYQLNVYDEGSSHPAYQITSDCYYTSGDGKAWKVAFDKDAYEYVTINVDIAATDNRRVWVEGQKKNDQSLFTLISGGEEYASNKTGTFTYNLTDAATDAVVSFKIGTDSYGLYSDATVSAEGTHGLSAGKDADGTLTLAKGFIYTITIASDGSVMVVAKKQTQFVTSDAGYYLVGNFFSKYNKEVVTPGPDGDDINYKKLYFKFEQKDGAYKFDLPACLTAKMQILAVGADGTRTVYAPQSDGAYGLHGGWPEKNTEVNGALAASAAISEAANYWSLTTRNDRTHDDDGMYTVSFTLGTDGTPSAWTIKHDASTRVAYLLSTAYGATAQAVYNTRNGGDGKYSDNTKAALHFDGKNSYYAIGYVVNDVSGSNPEQLAQAKIATPDIHPTASVHDNSGTHDKLFFLGNGGYEYNDSEHNKVWVNQKPFTLNIKGTKVIEYNPSRGNNELAGTDGTYGSTGSIYIANAKSADFPSAISMVGDAISGTTDGTEWNWASTAADMTYDANERCYKVTIKTDDSHKGKGFRFVGDHSKSFNWHEDSDTPNEHTALTDANPGGHSCLPDDANYVCYAENDETEHAEEGRHITWNQNGGLWTVRFYIDTDNSSNRSFRYTIEGTQNQPTALTFRAGKFIRTYSSATAMDVVSPNVKVYEAYKYEKPAQADDIYSQGTLYMRQLTYIPAGMGVVLIGQAPSDGSYADGDKVNFSLRERTEASATTETEYKTVWTKADSYTADLWNNFLVATVEANNSLGNTEEENGVVTHRFFGLGNFHRTAYYQQTQTGDDYIGFFRLTQDGRSGANKAYLSLPASPDVEGAAFGHLDYNGQFIGGSTDDEEYAALGKMQLAFDDELGETTGISAIRPARTADAAYYNLQGMKVMRPTKGIYIHGGKKVVVK